MIVAHCSCGRVLKLKDDLAGKKIKCPECASILTVKSPAKPGASDHPRKPVAEHEDDDAVAADRAPTAKKSTAHLDRPPRTTKRRPDEDEEEDRPPTKKKKGAKQNSYLLLLLLGGAAAVVLLLGAAVGAYFLFLKGTDGKTASPSATDKAADSNTASIVGLWQLKQTEKGRIKELTLECTADNRIMISGRDHLAFKMEGSYQMEGNKVLFTLRSAGPPETSRDRITKLTATELILENEDGKTETYLRVKK
jgi:uncharacterized protein (TIGR03066 family)